MKLQIPLRLDRFWVNMGWCQEIFNLISNTLNMLHNVKLNPVIFLITAYLVSIFLGFFLQKCQKWLNSSSVVNCGSVEDDIKGSIKDSRGFETDSSDSICVHPFGLLHGFQYLWQTGFIWQLLQKPLLFFKLQETISNWQMI